MKIESEQLLSVWYEDRQGNKYYPTLEDNPSTIDPSYCYQFSRFPHILQTNMLYIVEQDVVDNCDHPNDKIVIKNIEDSKFKSRECLNCHGTQTCEVKDFPEDWWPTSGWKAIGSRQLMTDNSSWSEDLVLAMVHSGDYNLHQSIIIASICCERCLNVLAYKYELKWGYSEFSNQWKLTNTCCEFCKHIK